jgi:hypothetical protein
MQIVMFRTIWYVMWGQQQSTYMQSSEKSKGVKTYGSKLEHMGRRLKATTMLTLTFKISGSKLTPSIHRNTFQKQDILFILIIGAKWKKDSHLPDERGLLHSFPSS